MHGKLENDSCYSMVTSPWRKPSMRQPISGRSNSLAQVSMSDWYLVIIWKTKGLTKISQHRLPMHEKDNVTGADGKMFCSSYCITHLLLTNQT